MQIIARHKWMSGVVLFLLALLLRTCGLSHDLHLGRVYHPDTPKQIRSVERFLQGDYYTVIGGRDYEGYPLFNSHLVEYLIRAYQFAGGLVSGHLGLSGQVDQPDYLSIFWITRILNATLSASAVWLVLLIGWRWLAPAAGIVAALLLTFSPVDITACHYANGDTAAAFFALLGVYLALRLLEKPSLPLYLAVGLVAAAAFSSKYHGGIALGTAGLAHIFHYAKARRLFSGASIGRGFLLVFAFIAGVFLTSPALLVYTDGAFEDIVQFFEYTASFGMTEEMRAMSTWERFRMGMSVNMPVLKDVVGIIPAIAAILALIAGFLRPPVWIIASLPLVYILAGLATKPLTHAVYHTMATPGIMLLAGFTLYWMQSGQRMLWPRRITMIALAAAATSYLAAYTYRELFFFRLNDTRYLAESWVRENIPSSFKLLTSDYTFKADDRKEGMASIGDPVDGEARVYSARVPHKPKERAIPVHSFKLEQDRLVVFRNWPQFVHINNASSFRQLRLRPGFNPLPSESRVNLIDADAPWWIRHQGTWNLSDSIKIDGALTSTQSLAQAAWYVRNGGVPSVIELSLGGERHRLELLPGESRIINMSSLEAMNIASSDRYFYEWQLRSVVGSPRVSLLTSGRDIAWAYFNTGQYAEAALAFEAMSAYDVTVGDRIAQSISALSSDRQPRFSANGKLNVDLLEDYGVSSAYLQALPGLVHRTNRWDYFITTNRLSAETLYREYRLPEYVLDPGHYLLRIETDAPRQDLEFVLMDMLGRPRSIQFIPEFAWSNGYLHVGFAVAPLNPVIKSALRLPLSSDEFKVSGTSIVPLPETTLKDYADLLALMTDLERRDDRPGPLWYEPLLAFARRLESHGEATSARICYELACGGNPHGLMAMERLVAMPGFSKDDELTADIASAKELFFQNVDRREKRPLKIEFANGVRLDSYQISSATAKPGETIGFMLEGKPTSIYRDLDRYELWLHAISADDKIMRFDAYLTLNDLLSANCINRDALEPYLRELAIPLDAPPGKYMLKAGFWIPTQNRQIRTSSGESPHDRRGVILTEIQVAE